MFRKIDNLDGAIFVLNKETKIGATVHTFFMLEPIDIIWINREGVVIDRRMNVKPFRIVIPKGKAKYVLELKNPLGKYFEIYDKIQAKNL